MIRELVEHIAKTIADKPDEISVEEITTSNSSIIEVKCAKEDQGKLIGKNGKTANSIRTIVFACGFKTKMRYQLEIIPKES